MEETPAKKSHVPNHNVAGRLNPVAPAFNPNSNEIASSKKGNNFKSTGNENGDRLVAHQGVPKESTAQWVNRTFVGNVTTNQSCQEIPSQSVDVTAVDGMSKGDERLQFSGGKLWCYQVEDDSEERELLDGVMGEEVSTDKEND